MKSRGCAQHTSDKRLTQLENHIFPAIGNRPVADIKPPEILAMVQGVAAKGTAYTAGRLREICGQVFRFAIQTGRAIYDPAAAMRGAIEKPGVTPPASIDHAARIRPVRA
jgi:integrase